MGRVSFVKGEDPLPRGTCHVTRAAWHLARHAGKPAAMSLRGTLSASRRVRSHALARTLPRSQTSLQSRPCGEPPAPKRAYSCALAGKPLPPHSQVSLQSHPCGEIDPASRRACSCTLEGKPPLPPRHVLEGRRPFPSPPGDPAPIGRPREVDFSLCQPMFGIFQT